jgi:hypothetical protein
MECFIADSLAFQAKDGSTHVAIGFQTGLGKPRLRADDRVELLAYLARCRARPAGADLGHVDQLKVHLDYRFNWDALRLLRDLRQAAQITRQLTEAIQLLGREPTANTRCIGLIS